MRALVTIMFAVALLAIALAAWKLCHVTSPTAAPALTKNWHEQVYGLDADEASRLIPPPYSPQRMQIMARGYYQHPMPGVMGQLAFYTGPGRGPLYPFGIMTNRGDLKEALQWSTIGEEQGIEGSLGNLAVDGDWYIRNEAPVELRVQALQSILRQITGHDLMIEKRFVDREVVVVAGTWNFKPLELPAGIRAKRVYLYVSDEEERKAFLESPRRGHIGDDAGYTLTDLRSGDFPTFLQIIGFYIGYRVVDETERPKPAAVEWGTRLGRQKFGQDPAALQLFFINMQAQTSLRFEVAKRPIPLWYVSERSGTTQPGDAK